MTLPQEVLEFLNTLVWHEINISTPNTEDRIKIAQGFRELAERGIIYDIDDVIDWLVDNDPRWDPNARNYILYAAEVILYAFGKY